MASTSFNPMDYGATPVGATPVEHTASNAGGFDPLAFGAVPVSKGTEPSSASSSSSFDPTAFGATPVGQPSQPQAGKDSTGWEFADKARSIWNSDEGTLSKVWDIANTPLFDLKREGAQGIEAGVEETASGLTSPLSAALSVLTLGAGGLLENIGLDVGKMAAPEVIQAAKTAGKLASAGFTAMQFKGIADESPDFVQAVKNGDTQKALEIGTNLLAGTAMGVLGAKHLANETGILGSEEGSKSTSAVQAVGHYMRGLKTDTEEAQNFNRDFKKAVPDQAQRSAIQMYAEAGGDKDTLAKWQDSVEQAKNVKPQLQRQVVDALRRAQDLNDDEISQASKLREMYDYDFARAADAKVLKTESQKNNFIARARWAREPVEQERVDAAKASLGQGLQDHTQRRIFDTTVDGILKGYEPVKSGGKYVLDAADLASDYHRSIGKAIAKKQFVDRLLGSVGADSRPLAVPGGSMNLFDKGEEGGKGVSLNSLNVPDQALNKNQLSVLKRNGKLQEMIDAGHIIDHGPRPDAIKPEALDKAYEKYLNKNKEETSLTKDEFRDKLAGDAFYKGRYRFNTDDYDNSIRHRYAWKSIYGGDEDTTLRAPIAFHPEIAKQAKLILNPEKSILEQNPITSKILGLSTQAKQSLLSLSGFHWVQEGLRGLESGINPAKPFLDMLKGEGGWDTSNPNHLRLIEAGGIQPGIEGAAERFTEGIKGHGPISKVPGVGPVIDRVNNALFGPNGYIDRLKLNTALHFADRLAETNPKLDPMTRYKVAGELANQRFGGLNYLQMGRSPLTQDIMRMTLLAPDWMESNLRDAASTLGPYGKISRFDMARIALYNFVVAQTLNMLNTGKMHLDTPFGVQSQDGKKVYSVRTMPADIFHALTDPRDYVSNRLNPLLSRTGVEFITGRDRQGHVRTPVQQVQDLISNISPIPLQGGINKLIGNFHPGETTGDYVRSGLGLTTKANHSPAEDLAFRLASQNSSSGNLPSEQAAHFHRVMLYEDRLRDGDSSALADLQNDVRSGKLAIGDYRQILKGKTMDRLSAVVNRLPMSQALDVWDRATNAERDRLAPIMHKKMGAFRRTEAQKLTPGERAEIDVRLAKATGDMLHQAGVQ